METYRRYDQNGVLIREILDGAEQSLATRHEIRRQAPWPLWAQGLKLAAKPGDKGIGDVIERTIGPVGGDAYKKWFEKITGKPCGCIKRRDVLNQKYPLDG